MKQAPWLDLDRYRIDGPINEPCGAFILKRKSASLLVLVSDGDGWDHVSVSTKNRVPTWDEMEYVKHRFFEPHEWAMQLHAPPALHINNHPFVLHIWRPQDGAIPLPPSEMV